MLNPCVVDTCPLSFVGYASWHVGNVIVYAVSQPRVYRIVGRCAAATAKAVTQSTLQGRFEARMVTQRLVESEREYKAVTRFTSV